MTKKWTTFTSIGSQDSLDKNKNFCSHTYKHEQSHYCGYCLNFFCRDCLKAHSKRFHPSVKRDKHAATTINTENTQECTSAKAQRDEAVLSNVDIDIEGLRKNTEKLSLEDVQCQDDGRHLLQQQFPQNQSDFEEIVYETSLSFLKMTEVIRTSELNNSFPLPASQEPKSLPQPIYNQCTRISGIISSGNLLIAADYCNKRLMVIDTNYYNLVSEISFATSPWDLTMIEMSYIAVTLTFERKIVFLRLQKNKLVFDKEVKVTGYCDGISTYKKTLLVTLVNPGSLVLMDHHGNTIKTIETADNGERLFDEPRHAVFSPDGKRIYVSDFQRNSVVCLGIGANSDLILKYKSKHLKGPENLQVDRTGCVYVCASSSNSIHILSAECRQLYILFDQHIKYPQSLFCCLATMKLYIGLDGDTDILVFQLKIRENNINNKVIISA